MPVQYTASSHPTQETFLFMGNNRFELISPDPAKKGKTKFYTGVFAEKPDTIFLEFYKEIKPGNRETFLLKDKDGLHIRYPYLQGKTSTLLAIKRKES